MYWGSFRQERRGCSWSRAMLGYAILGVWTAGHHHHHHHPTQHHHHHPTHHHHHQQYHHHRLQAHEWGDSMTCRTAIVWCLWPAALWIKKRHLTEPEFQQMGLLGSVAGIEGIPLAMAMVWKISCPSLGTPLKEDNDQAQISLPDLFGKSNWIWMEFFISFSIYPRNANLPENFLLENCYTLLISMTVSYSDALWFDKWPYKESKQQGK